MTIKRCNVCENYQPIGEFYRDSKAADGRQRTCRTCRRQERPAPVNHAAVGDWQDDAACRTVDARIFWAENEGPALAVCRRCDVVDKCLDWALRTHQNLYVIGGTTAAERARMLAAKRINEETSR